MMGSIYKRVDLPLVIPVSILLLISLATLFSINGLYFRNQLIFIMLSLGIFLFFTQVDFSLLESLSKYMYIASIIGLLFLLLIGFESRGAVRWLDFFGLRLQFSEICKPFLAVGLASFLTSRPKVLSTLGLLGLLGAPVLFLIYKQPDLGSALMYLFAGLLTILIYGYPLLWFAIGLFGLFAFIPLLFNFLHAYQKQRILTFLHITNDPLGSSYNAIQAMIAVGSGLIVGKGLGQGTQSALRFLPERQTDFIFATLAESLGFLGSVVVIACFGFLLYRLYTIAREAPRKTEKVFVVATFSLILIQFFVNAGMNMGIVPIVGVTLPFVSYGGSSLLSNAVFLGLASGIAQNIRGKSALEIT